MQKLPNIKNKQKALINNKNNNKIKYQLHLIIYQYLMRKCSMYIQYTNYIFGSCVMSHTMSVVYYDHK